MTDALRYLLVHSAKNRLRGQLARLRRPRYVLAIVAGGAYFGTLLFNSRMPSPLSGSTSSALGQLIYTAVIFVTIAGGWILGSDRPALVFSEAEVQLLFPAPVSRAALVRYKVAQAQLVVLFSVLIWVVLLRRGGTTLPFWMRAISLFSLEAGTSSFWWRARMELRMRVPQSATGSVRFIHSPSSPVRSRVSLARTSGDVCFG